MTLSVCFFEIKLEYGETMKKVLFFSRGKGWGHSIRDIEIAKRMRSSNEYDMLFASYGAGYKAYSIKGISCCDLKCSENAYGGQLIKPFISLIREIKPAWIVSDEEVLILPIAASYDIPCCYITNYFVPQDAIESTCIHYSEFIIFAEYDDLCPQNVPYKIPIHYVGPICQNFHTVKKKATVQNSGDKKIILVLLGGSTQLNVRLANMQLVKTIIESNTPNVVYRIVSEEMRYVFACLSPDNVEWLPRSSGLAKEVASCDGAIIRGGINTIWEMAFARVPNITVPYPESINPMEICYAETMEKRGYTKVIRQAQLSPLSLNKQIENLLQSPNIFSFPNAPNGTSNDAAAKAAHILDQWIVKSK